MARENEPRVLVAPAGHGAGSGAAHLRLAPLVVHGESEYVRRCTGFPDGARNMGIHIQAGRGSGKSILMGRLLALYDFLRGLPVVIFDPVGATIDNFLDALSRIDVADQEAFGLPRRLLYVDMAGGERVVPFPLYYRAGDESYYEIARRLPSVIQMLDPALSNAPILGQNALESFAVDAGMVLSALGYQITEASDLLVHPDRWEARLKQAAKVEPCVAGAVDFFLSDYMQRSPGARSRDAGSFLTKTKVFDRDPTSRAMFGVSTPGIDWASVVRERQVVLLDFRRELDPARRRFKMLWAFQTLFDFIKRRGRTRSGAISVIVDEITELTGVEREDEVNEFARALNELTNVYMRNCMVWLTLAHQEPWQVGAYTRRTLMSLGTQILGVTSDMDAALAMARQYFSFEPDWIRRYEPVWMSGPMGAFVVDYRPVEFTVEEQQYLTSEFFKKLRTFQFLVRPSASEGDMSGRIRPVDIRPIVAGHWLNEAFVESVRAELAAVTGVSTAKAVAEIEGRLERRIVGQKGKKRLRAAEKRARYGSRKMPPREGEALDTMEDDIDYDEFIDPRPDGR